MKTILRVSFWLLLLATPVLAWDDEPAAGKLPADLERVLAWLPEDTQSLIVARSFELQERLKGPADVNADNFKSVFVGSALDHFLVLNDKAMAPLPQKRVKLAVCGGRNAQIVSAFGSVRKECCSIIVLDKPLGAAAGKWKESLQAKAERTRTILDQEVWVFPSFIAMEGVYKPTEWQGTYVALIEPDVILCATSDRYLEELLKRRKSSPKTRALPADLPEWKHIDGTSPAWMLWHAPSDEKSVIHGGGWTWRDDLVEFIYVPKHDAAEVEKAWNARWDNGKLLPHPKPGESLLHQRAGAVVVPVATKNVDAGQAFLLALFAGALEAEPLRVGDSR